MFSSFTNKMQQILEWIVEGNNKKFGSRQTEKFSEILYI